MKKSTRRAFLRDFTLRAGGIGAALYTLAPLGGIVADVISPPQRTVDHHEKDPKDHSLLHYLGTANFATNIATLAKTGDLTGFGYPVQAGLLGLLYHESNDSGKHHILKEITDGRDALRIILGTTIGCEGIEMSLDTITKEAHGRPSTLEEKLFMISALTPLTSSATTTVGSSTIFREDVQSLVSSIVAQRSPKDPESLRKDLYATLIAHVADNSGFMGLGDPPFIAMVQKYGPQGMIYQNKTMWPLLLGSSVNLVGSLASKLGVEKNAVSILSNSENWELYRRVMSETGFNALKFVYNLTGDDYDRGVAQDPLGITLNSHAYEDRVSDLLAASSAYASRGLAHLREGKLGAVLSDLTPKTAKHILEDNVGPNMADVLTIFPYQAMSIPFLQPVFEKALGTLEGFDPTVKDAVFYLAIAGFSSLADNYVACKIGLELYPTQPELPLTASIIGGSLLPPGNMANMTLADTKTYGIADALSGARALRRNWMQLGSGLAYSKAIPHLRNLPILGELYSDRGILSVLEAENATH